MNEPPETERLLTTARRVMLVRHDIGEVEIRSEQRRDLVRIVSLDGQSTACRRSVRPEGRDNRAAANLECASQTCHVRIALIGRSQEVENGSIVPDVDGRNLPRSHHVCFKPRDARRFGSQSATRARECSRRHIEHRHAGETAFQQAIDEAGIPTSDIDDSGVRSEASALQHP